MKTTRRSFLQTLATALTLACAAPPAFAATPNTGRTGLQAIGLLAFADDQIQATSDILVSVLPGKDVGIHYLAYSFVQGAVANVRSKNDFAKVDHLIKITLPRLPAGSRLIVQTSLDDGPNRQSHQDWVTFRPDLSVSQFWSGVAADSRRLRANWVANVAQPFKIWSDEILNWASTNGHSGKLRLDLCLVLEDRCPQNSSYARLLAWTKSVGLNSSIVFVRNPVLTNLPSDGRVVGLSRVEFHRVFNRSGDLATGFLQNRLLPGYIISNDGKVVNGMQWADIQRTALARNASAYIWRTSFNGDRDNLPPSQRGPLTPFDYASKASAIGWIQSRFGL